VLERVLVTEETVMGMEMETEEQELAQERVLVQAQARVLVKAQRERQVLQ